MRILYVCNRDNPSSIKDKKLRVKAGSRISGVGITLALFQCVRARRRLKMKNIKSLGILLLLITVFCYAEDQEYTNNSFARLSYVNGNAFIQRSSELAYEEGVLNMPIAEGDRVGTTEGRVEVYSAKGKYIRLDNDTKVDFIHLPKRGNDLIQIRVWSGHVYFSVNSLAREKSLEIHTADVSIYVLNEGLYRIDVKQNQETEIFVFSGLIEAAGESGSVLIKESHRVEAIEGHFTSRPIRFHAIAEDSFDRWNSNRDMVIREQLAQNYLPGNLEDYERELQDYGKWTYVEPYGYVWVPGGLENHWRPYYNGRWIWISTCGWTWLPYEPWGWVTAHFGRWHWHPGIGWYWIPTTVWGPAWVSWYWGFDFCAWAPLSYYGYPGVIINNVYYSRYSNPDYPYYSNALTVIRKAQLQSPDISRVVLDRESVSKLGKISLSKNVPTEKPVGLDVSVEKLSGNKVFLRKNGKFPESKEAQIPHSSEEPEGFRQDESKDKHMKNMYPSPQFNNTQNPSGYPSSPRISLKTHGEEQRGESSKSPLSRFIDYISKGSRSIDKSDSSGEPERSSPSRTNAVKSRSSSETKSSTVRSSAGSSPRASSKKSTPPSKKTSSSGKSSSGKIKKK